MQELPGLKNLRINEDVLVFFKTKLNHISYNNNFHCLCTCIHNVDHINQDFSDQDDRVPSLLLNFE